MRQQCTDRINDINSKIVNYNIWLHRRRRNMALLIVYEELADYQPAERVGYNAKRSMLLFNIYRSRFSFIVFRSLHAGRPRER